MFSAKYRTITNAFDEPCAFLVSGVLNLPKSNKQLDGPASISL